MASATHRRRAAALLGAAPLLLAALGGTACVHQPRPGPDSAELAPTTATPLVARSGTVEGLAWKVIPFGELAPAAYPQSYSWNAIGADAEGRVYVVFGDGATYEPEPPDCLLYAYDSRTGGRSRLGSFARAALEAGNLKPDEGFMKGHTALVAAGGKLWMGSMPFHDATEPAPAGYRGSHLFAWDPAAGQLADASAAEAGGVVQARSGILVLASHPASGGLVGLSVPRGDLLFFESGSGRLQRVVPGPAAEYRSRLPRNLVVAPDGRVFLAFARDDGSSALFVCDPGSERLRELATANMRHFWNGSALTPDGRGAYVATSRGRLYYLDFALETFEDLGDFLPASELARGDSVKELFCLALDAAGERLYAIPTSISTREQALYEYGIASRSVRRLLDLRETGLFGMTFTGSDVRDLEGRLYFAVHYYGREGYLLQIDPGADAGEAPGGVAGKRPLG